MREFTLPDVGEGVAEGELLEWLVAPGDVVTEGQVVARVETDKATVDVPSPVDGRVRERHAQPGDIVPVGDVFVTFDEEGGGADAGSEASVGSSVDRVFAPPSTRKLARELGVDIAEVGGSSPGSRVTEADVRAAAEKEEASDDDSDDHLASVRSDVEGADRGAGESGGVPDDGTTGTVAGPEPAGRDRTLAAPATRRVASELDVDLDDVPAVEERDGEAFVSEAAVREYARARQAARAGDAAAMGGSRPERAESNATREHREPYRGVRKTVGEAMERSKFTAPHVTHHDTVDVTALVEARDTLEARMAERGVDLTYLPFVIKAVVAALEEHPVLNASLDEENDEIVYRNDYDIGVATATDAGLLVPVVENVDDRGLVEVAADVTELTAKARDRTISREELRGSTFTVTNFGAIGGEYATPIINYPETGILGLGAIEKRPWVHDGEVVGRATLPLSLSVDHRVVDGADAARFTNTLTEYLQDPTLLLLE